MAKMNDICKKWTEKASNFKKSAQQQYRRDRIRGSLIGGAAGDALGYAVEFSSLDNIRKRYGTKGITAYELDANGKAIISDDTQMTLFTANGLLNGQTEALMQGIAVRPLLHVLRAYDDWYATQVRLEKRLDAKDSAIRQTTWLFNIPELHESRAPGTTCLRALKNAHGQDGYERAINDSKGCGCVMRIAPIGLFIGFGQEKNKAIEEGGAIAAITHGHPLGWLSACILAELLRHIVYDELEPGYTLEEAILKCTRQVGKKYEGEPFWQDLVWLINKAIDLAGNRKPDERNIRELGEGWVAEETLAIAVYCAVRHSGDFSDGIIAAVNHDGDSDSTGSITGNILGAWLGISRIDRKWQDNLELKDVILEIADDLCDGCPMSGTIKYKDHIWCRKYVDCTYPHR